METVETLQVRYLKMKAKRDKWMQLIGRKEKSINALIERQCELEADLRYEVRLNEQLRTFIENKLKINAK